MLMLRPLQNDMPPGSLAWCGPSCIAILANRPVSEVRAEIVRECGLRPNFSGMNMMQIKNMLRHYGVEFVELKQRELCMGNSRMTLDAWLASSRRKLNATYAVATPTHIMLVSGALFVDNQSGKIVQLSDWYARKWKRSRVSTILEITRVPWMEG